MADGEVKVPNPAEERPSETQVAAPDEMSLVNEFFEATDAANELDDDGGGDSLEPSSLVPSSGEEPPPSVSPDPQGEVPPAVQPAAAPAEAVQVQQAPPGETGTAEAKAEPGQLTAEQQAAIDAETARVAAASAAAQPGQEATSTTGQQPQLSPDQAFHVLERAIEEQKPKVVEALAQHTYRFGDEEMEEFNNSPETAIPKLAAKIHVQAVQGVLQHIAQQLPGVVNGLLTARSQAESREKDFYSQWPMLKADTHAPMVRQLAAAYRQANPNADFKEMSRVVGAQAVVALGLIPTAQAPQAAAQARPTPNGFVPARVGSPSPGAPQQPVNPFTQYDIMLEQEDSGMFDDS